MPPQVSVEGEMTEIDSVEPQNLAEETPEAIVRQALARPKIELTEDIMFKILVAEVAGQRGDIKIAVENYMELAKAREIRL